MSSKSKKGSRNIIIKRTIRISDDELGLRLSDMLKHEIPGKYANERLVEDIHFAEALRKHFNYLPISEILLLMINNNMNIPKAVKEERIESSLNTRRALDMLNNFNG